MARKRDINDVTDDISMIMREVVETAEANMLTEIAASLNIDLTKVKSPRDYLVQQAGLNKALSNRLFALSKQTEQQQINIAKNIGVYAGINTAPLEDEIKKGSKILLQSAQSEKNAQVQKIYRLNKFNTSAQFIPDLKASIIKQTEEGIENGLPVTFKNGRKVGYREYMEMAVRTGIQQEIGQQQIEIAKQANIVFFLCDEFADCADDHADYQGKVYYNADYQSFSLTEDAKLMIGNAIKAKQFLSVQEVRDGEPYLTTRPNCRHRFIPISIDEAIGEDLGRVKTSVDSVRGNYRPENYEALKAQRTFERNIRKNKKTLETFELLKTKTKSGDYDEVIRRKTLAIRSNQAKLRKLLELNPSLSRERRRETRKILIKDLGVKYNLNKGGVGQPPISVVAKPPEEVPLVANEQIKLEKTVAEHYAMPEEKQVYIKEIYERKWEDKPDLWNNARGKYKYDETYNKWVGFLKSKDDQYNDDQKYTIRDKVSYLYKSMGKHFSGLSIKFGEGQYTSGMNEVEFRAIGATSQSEMRTIEIATHEFGHAFDFNIGKKIFPKLDGFIKVPTQLSAGRKAIDHLIRRFKNDRTLPAAVKEDYIENKIKKPFFDAIDKMTTEQREIFEAGDQFSQSVQNAIKQNKPSKLLETEIYKKVKEFDNAPEIIKEQVIDEQGLRPLYDKVGAYKKYEAGQRNLRLRFPMNDTEKASYEAACKLLGKDPTEILDSAAVNELNRENRPIQEEWDMQWALQQRRIKEKTDDYEKENMHITQMSDFLDALSLGTLRDFGKLRYGHGTKYYKGNTGDSEVEIFTHLQTLNMMKPDDYNLVKKEFPDICIAFENVISKSVDYLIKTEGVGGNE